MLMVVCNRCTLMQHLSSWLIALSVVSKLDICMYVFLHTNNRLPSEQHLDVREEKKHRFVLPYLHAKHLADSNICPISNTFGRHTLDALTLTFFFRFLKEKKTRPCAPVYLGEGKSSNTHQSNLLLK